MKGKRGKALRAQGQTLGATAFIGKAGLTSTVAAEVAAQLKLRGLVKVKISPEAAGAQERLAIAEALAQQASAELVEVRGFTALLAKRGKVRSRDASP